MGEATRQHDPGHSGFLEVVSDLAEVIRPLCGLADLAAKILALKTERQRLRIEQSTARPGQPARRRHRGPGSLSTGQATDLAATVSYPDAMTMQAGLSLQQIERTYQAVMAAIRVDATARCREADQKFITEVRRIDTALHVELVRLADERRRADQRFALERELLRAQTSERKEIARALAAANKLTSSRRHVALATQAAQTCSIALAMSMQATPPRDAVLIALSHDREVVRPR